MCFLPVSLLYFPQLFPVFPSLIFVATDFQPGWAGHRLQVWAELCVILCTDCSGTFCGGAHPCRQLGDELVRRGWRNLQRERESLRAVKGAKTSPTCSKLKTEYLPVRAELSTERWQQSLIEEIGMPNFLQIFKLGFSSWNYLKHPAR